MVLNTADWLELIGLGRSPTVMLGHSISASALMCVREAELGGEAKYAGRAAFPVPPQARG
jgi:hypothetical protein